jgi:hypothetical protein
MLAVLAAAVACIAAGCGASACPKTALSREQLVRQYNANSAGVPRLWARVRIDMNLTDADGKSVQWGSSLGSPNGLLLLAKDGASQQPGFLLCGTMPGGNELFRMGASRSESLYYLWYNAGNNRRAWLGQTELAGAPGIDIPLDPTQLLGVLGVTDLPTDFTTLPTVALTFSTSPCAYVLTYVDRQPLTGQILFRREVYLRWSDTEPPRPFLVNIFDNDGRRVMTATLKDYKSVAGAPASTIMPSDIQIAWPQRKSSLHLVLSEMSSAHAWDDGQLLFRANLPPAITGDQIIEVDKNLAAPGGK